MEEKSIIKNFLDDSGKIAKMPKNKKKRYAILEYLTEKFEYDCYYTEQDVNDICSKWHTFGDYFLLRRELIDYGLLCREKDGSRYWRKVDDKSVES